MGCIVIRENDHKPVSKKKNIFGYQFESLGYKWSNKMFNPFLLTYMLQPKDAPLPSFKFEGEEFIYLLEGKLEMYYDKECYHLNPGDCIFLDGRVPHGGRAYGKKKAIALLISMPKSMRKSKVR